MNDETKQQYVDTNMGRMSIEDCELPHPARGCGFC